MFLFQIKDRWLNITAVTAFFGVGYIILFNFQTIIFIYAAILMFPILGFEFDDSKHYLDPVRLKWYSNNYLSSYYRLLFSFTYVYFSFYETNQLSLDSLFFLVWYVTLSAWWYLIFFFPKCGVLDVDEWWQATVAMPILIVSVLTFLGWILMNVSGFTVVGKIIMTPVDMALGFARSMINA